MTEHDTTELAGNIEPPIVETTDAPIPEAVVTGFVLTANTDEVVFQQRLYHFTPHAFLTLLLVISNVVIFLLMAFKLTTVDPISQSLVDLGGNIAIYTKQGEWWRLLTCLFLHASIMHVAFNMYVLWDIGNFTERLFGNSGFLVCYLLAGISGSLASLAFNPANMVSVGASGAIFGLYGALFGALLRGKRDGSIPATSVQRLLRSGMMFVGINIAYAFIYGLFSSKIDIYAHLGGLTGGFLCGLLLAHPLTASGVAGRLSREVRLALVGVGLLIGVFFLIPYQQTLAGFRYHFFQQIEPQCWTGYNNALQQVRAKTIDEQHFAEIIDYEVLPPWQKDQQVYHALQSKISANDQPLYKLIGAYIDTRAASWSAQARALRSRELADTNKMIEANTVADEAQKKLDDFLHQQ